MAKVYSALKMRMGSWDYYVVKMRMAEAASEIRFATEFKKNPTLETHIQRTMNEGRARTQIVDYLKRNDQRFFSSLVVAALDGEPRWFSVGVNEDPRFEMVAGDLTDCFGVLMFNDTLKIYALDGQHRLFAIKHLIDGEADDIPPAGFHDETISVIFVIPPTGTTEEDFTKSYRRLFSSLNRHAKPTDPATNIIMDEDDRFAILTRRLISESEQFKWDGVSESKIVDHEKKGESLNTRDDAFTTIITFYKMNIHLLWDLKYQADWGVPFKGSFKQLIQQCPEEDELDEMYDQLDRIWDAIFLTLPELRSTPSEMRNHGHEYGDGYEDHLLFWPIGQSKLLAPLVRRLMNEADIKDIKNTQEVVEALKPLKHIPWDLKHDFWRDFVLIYDGGAAQPTWKMRNEDREKVMALSYTILTWLTGCETFDEDTMEDLKIRWASYLIPPGENTREEDTWNELEEIRELILDN